MLDYLSNMLSNILPNTLTNTLTNIKIKTQPKPSCSNGYPVSKLKFSDEGTINLTESNILSDKSLKNSDVLYSLYNSYQKTFTPNYIQNNILKLRDPSNYTNLPMGPSNIFIIRHGEKNSDNFNDPTNKNTFYDINLNGIYRSIELPNFINDLGTKGFPITAIVTANPNMSVKPNASDISTRPEQTIMLSSWILNIPLYIFSSTNVSQPYDATTAINIFTNPSLRGRNIVVAFEHDNMQSLTNQLVQCYNYFKQGGTVQNLNNSTLYNVSTEAWWKKNTPVSSEHQYPGFKSTQGIPPYPIPYQKYSQYLPYINVNTFDKVYWLSQTKVENSLTIDIFYQNIYTCFPNCHLTIGLIQYPFVSNKPGWTNSYKNNSKCLPPS